LLVSLSVGPDRWEAAWRPGPKLLPMHPADKDRPPLNGSIPDPDAPLPFYGVISIPQDILYGDESEPLDELLRTEIESMATALVNNVYAARFENTTP
jgi:hypothetical protein